MPIGYNMECPKCHYNRNDQDMECPRCGIVYDKYELLIKKKDENNRNQISPAQNPAVSQNPSTISLFYKLKYYLGGIILGIITAALIIYHYNSKINRLIDANNRITANSVALQGTQSEEYEPETRDELQDFTGQPEDARPDSRSINSADAQANGSRSRNTIEEACRAVVTIKTASGFGSGFFINEDGYILTNKHVSEMNENVQDSLYNARQSLRNELKEKEALLSDIEDELAGKKNDIDTENSWISENTDDRYYGKLELEEKVAEIKSHQARLQSHAREYNVLMNRYNSEKAKADMLRQKYEQANSQIDQLASNTSLTIYLADGTKKTASIISNSYNYDMALLKIDGVKTPFIRPADVNQVKVGDTLYAIGTPQGFSQTVTSGILSSFRDGYIQTNAQISPGNSGGPLIDNEGKAVGINTSKIVAEGVEGIGFAIPINVVVQEYNQYFY
jgi:serine protease Do